MKRRYDGHSESSTKAAATVGFILCLFKISSTGCQGLIHSQELFLTKRLLVYLKSKLPFIGFYFANITSSH